MIVECDFMMIDVGDEVGGGVDICDREREEGG